MRLFAVRFINTRTGENALVEVKAGYSAMARARAFAALEASGFNILEWDTCGIR
jgi:hypothetical protein